MDPLPAKPSIKRLLIVALVTTVLGGAGAGLLRLPSPSPSNQDYSRVEEGLYIGGSVDRPPRGTQAVVNVCGRPERYQVAPSLWAPL